MMSNRRDFLRCVTAAATTAVVRPAFADKEAGLLATLLAIPPGRGAQEVTTVNAPSGENGAYWMLYGEKNVLVNRHTKDGGRSWSEPVVQRTVDGDTIPMARNTAHLTLLALKSGQLGIVYGGPVTRPGRDGAVLFRTSKDGGKTWSRPTPIDPVFAVCRTQAARVLSSGRIVVPVMRWISPFTGGESEGGDKNLCFSWVYYSDDNGQTWHRSHSELFVSLDEGRRGVTHFEETVIEERTDGQLLMFGRTELGQIYKSYSKDQGNSWSHPVPTGLASSYAPSTLIRIPQTKDLLLVWNQVSAEEILTGLHRHRLSTAISKDDGETWDHFRNLESLDDRTRIEAPKGRPEVIRMKEYGYRPPDKKHYPHAPGCLRICYATVGFAKDEVAISYDYGYGVGPFKNASSTRVKVVSLDWLYGRSS